MVEMNNWLLTCSLLCCYTFHLPPIRTNQTSPPTIRTPGTFSKSIRSIISPIRHPLPFGLVDLGADLVRKLAHFRPVIALRISPRRPLAPFGFFFNHWQSLFEKSEH